MLNFIWCGFFIVSFIFATYQFLFVGNLQIFGDLVSAVFVSAKGAFEITLNLTGMICLWMGLLKIAEQAGLTQILAKSLRPLFSRIMPEVPNNSPAIGSIILNMAANILGLDNAATPIGIRAMEQLQEVNPHKDKASSAQILFMVINTSAVTLIPITILMYRQELGATNPTAVFIPILFATSISTLVGFLTVAIAEKLPVFNRVVLAYIAGFLLFIVGVAYYFIHLDVSQRIIFSNMCGNFILFTMIIGFILAGIIKKLDVYATFINGACEGFDTVIKIIPYMVSMLVAIAVLRASGVFDYLLLGFEYVFNSLHINTDFVPALPTAFLKPLSGSGARAMMIETMQTYGADSFPAFVSGIIQGSTETTFYVLAVYFGAVKISRTGSAVPCALLADLAGIISAIYLGYLFY